MESPSGRTVNFAPERLRRHLPGTMPRAERVPVPPVQVCQMGGDVKSSGTQGSPCHVAIELVFKGRENVWWMRYTPGAVAKWANWAFPSLRTVVDLFLLFFINRRSHSSTTYLKHVYVHNAFQSRVFVLIHGCFSWWGFLICSWRFCGSLQGWQWPPSNDVLLPFVWSSERRTFPKIRMAIHTSLLPA